MIKIFNLQFEDNNMELRELLEIFGKGNVIDNPLVLVEMRKYIAENRKLLFEMNYKWHENEEEITELFSRIIGKTVDKRGIIPAPIHIGNKVWIGAGAIITKGVPAKIIKSI